MFVSDLTMPQWASGEGGGSEAESPDQMMLYYEDETSEYYDNKPDIADKIEQAGGEDFNNNFKCFENASVRILNFNLLL